MILISVVSDLDLPTRFDFVSIPASLNSSHGLYAWIFSFWSLISLSICRRWYREFSDSYMSISDLRFLAFLAIWAVTCRYSSSLDKPRYRRKTTFQDFLADGLSGCVVFRSNHPMYVEMCGILGSKSNRLPFRINCGVPGPFP
jgi:hypothetical protein